MKEVNLNEFVPIVGYEGIYSISHDGQIFSHINNRILKPSLNGYGYRHIVLCKKGLYKRFLVHRLVAIHFISEIPFEKAQVNHIDCNKQNNNYKNLEWVTNRENVMHAIKSGRYDRHFESMRGSMNPRFGDHSPRSKETREKISRAMLGKKNAKKKQAA